MYQYMNFDYMGGSEQNMMYTLENSPEAEECGS